jgi:translation initiation factor 1
MSRNRKIVYSTDNDAMERIREQARAAQRPLKVRSLPPCEQTAKLTHDRKGRGGKTVVVINDLVLSENDLKALAKTLKKKCGVGGAVKDGTIEIQGDIRDRVAAELEKLGYKTKLAGG